MKYVIHCGGIPFDGHTLKTKSLGGSESAAYYLALELAKDPGNDVTMFTNADLALKVDGVSYYPAGHCTEDAPLGQLFEQYATSIPTDVLIIQRRPDGIKHRYAAKQTYLWEHDIPHPSARKTARESMKWVTGILSVSNYQRKLISKAWDIPLKCIHTIQNAVDHSLYKEIKHVESSGDGEFNLVYTSRPERGLINLVKPGGIMDQLKERNKDGPRITLAVCTYDINVPSMTDYYNDIARMCKRDDVIMLPALNKKELAELHTLSDLMVYPTEFLESSCITAMEAMAAGLPMLTTNIGAIPETTTGSGTILMSPQTGGGVKNKQFADVILMLRDCPETMTHHRERQLAAAVKHSWVNVATRVSNLVSKEFKRTSTPTRLKHLLSVGDIVAANQIKVPETNPLATHQKRTIRQYAAVFDEEKVVGFYDDKVRDTPPVRGDVRNDPRFKLIAKMIPEGTQVVLDYGCSNGHGTIALARMFPDIHFVGWDISRRNIQHAKTWARESGVHNVEFQHNHLTGGWMPPLQSNAEYISPMVLLVSEVLEHIPNPALFIQNLIASQPVVSRVIMSTPYGPWDERVVGTDVPAREHINLFEESNIRSMFGHQPNFKMVVLPTRLKPSGEPLGHYVYQFDAPNFRTGKLDYVPKLEQATGEQTLSCCMIVASDAGGLTDALNSVGKVIDELVIGIDPKQFDLVSKPIETFKETHPWVLVLQKLIKSPLETGFADARNSVISKASGDWILVLDADETLQGVEHIPRLIWSSMYDGVAIRQVNTSLNPVSILSTDKPVRLYRNNSGIRYQGLVHEQPMAGNQAIKYTTASDDIVILHNGYANDQVRQTRFLRNYPLIKRDRRINPQRALGKMLYVRDIAQVLQNNPPCAEKRVEMINEGIALWKTLLTAKSINFATNSVQYVSTLYVLRGGRDAFTISFATSRNWGVNGDHDLVPKHATFDNTGDAKRFLDVLNKGIIDGPV